MTGLAGVNTVPASKDSLAQSIGGSVLLGTLRVSSNTPRVSSRFQVDLFFVVALRITRGLHPEAENHVGGSLDGRRRRHRVGYRGPSSIETIS